MKIKKVIKGDAITKLSDMYGISVNEKKHKALCGKGIIAGQRVMLIKPQTFMNLSGEAVQAFCHYFKLKAEEVLVICDDITIPWLKFKISR